MKTKLAKMGAQSEQLCSVRNVADTALNFSHSDVDTSALSWRICTISTVTPLYLCGADATHTPTLSWMHACSTCDQDLDSQHRLESILQPGCDHRWLTSGVW